MQTKNVEVDYTDLYEMVSLVYRQWASEFDALKKVRQEKDDGSKDWADFHRERMRRHVMEEAKWKNLLDRNVRILNLNAL